MFYQWRHAMSSGWVFKHCALYFMDRHIKSRWHIFATCFTKKWDTVQSHSSLNHKMFYDFSKRWVGGKGDDKVFDKSLEAKTESEYYDYRKIWGLIWQRSLAIFEENIFVQDLIFHTFVSKMMIFFSEFSFITFVVVKDWTSGINNLLQATPSSLLLPNSI